MTDLTEMVEWLRKQIEDDQAHAEKDLWVAARTTPGNWRALYGVNLPASCVTVEDDTIITLSADRHEADAMHVARFKPETVARRARDTIARCEAELAIIGEHFGVLNPGEPHRACRICSDKRADDDPLIHDNRWARTEPSPCPTLRLLAHGRRHRPGWKETWKP